MQVAVRGQELDDVDVRVDPAGRGRNERVPVVAGVRRGYRPGEPVVRSLGHDPASCFVESRVRADDPDGGVGPAARGTGRQLSQHFDGAEAGAAVARVDVPECVDGAEDTDDKAAQARDVRGQSRRTAPQRPSPVAHVGSCPGAHPAGDHLRLPGGRRGQVPVLRVGPHGAVAYAKVKEGQRRDDRHPARGRLVPAAGSARPAQHDAIGRGEAERGAAGEQDGVNSRDSLVRGEQLDFLAPSAVVSSRAWRRDATVPSGSSTTVQPVWLCRSVQWPTRTPATASPAGGSPRRLLPKPLSSL